MRQSVAEITNPHLSQPVETQHIPLGIPSRVNFPPPIIRTSVPTVLPGVVPGTVSGIPRVNFSPAQSSFVSSYVRPIDPVPINVARN